MKLGVLLKALESAAPLPADAADREISAIAHDSRKVGPGTLFVAIRGFRTDGHRFIDQAIRQGAAAVVVEEAGPDRGHPAPVIRVSDTRSALARLATVFYGEPSRDLNLVGITGTKGKTTVSYLVKSVIEAGGNSAGLIGTIDYRIGNTVIPAPNTTPESLELQKLLRDMVDAGAAYCVMEVSSHGLALGRTEGCVFETAVFTNLAEDHLDFHENRESYFQAKLRLFTGLASDKTAVVNADDEAGRMISRRTPATVYTYGMSAAADIRPSGPVQRTIDGISFTAATPAGDVAVASRLVGTYNVLNILAAIGAGIALGLKRDAIAAGIVNMRAVPGRMEAVAGGQPFAVIVDYAHTEASLANVLDALRESGPARIITVFGCGGDRDRSKRPKMAVAAGTRSDLVIITTDNPRSEDPTAIIAEIEAGMIGVGYRAASGRNLLRDAAGRTPYLVIPDRKEAIVAAVGLAEPGDAVLLAGKGHETYQIVGDVKTHFDDREISREAIGIRYPHARRHEQGLP